MALREIIILPDKQLRLVSKSVETVTAEIRRLADDMLETMYDAPGIGLAASQVDVHKQVIVLDVSERRDSLVVLVNTEIENPSALLKPEMTGFARIHCGPRTLGEILLWRLTRYFRSDSLSW